MVKKVVKKVKKVVKRIVKKKVPAAATELVPASKASHALAQILEAMTPATRKAYHELSAMLDKVTSQAIETWYHVGEKIRTVKGKRADYGDAAVEQLAEALHVDPNRLYEAVRVVNAYTLPMLKQLLASAGKQNAKLSWSHVSLIAGYPSADKGGQVKRKELEKAICEGRLTVRELQAELKRRTKKGPAKSGRKVAIPKNPVAATAQICKFKLDIEKRLDGLDEALFNWINDASLEDLTPGLHTRVSEALADVLAMLKFCEALKTKLGKALERTGKAVARHKAEAEQPTKKKRGPKPGVHEEEQPERDVDEIVEEDSIVEETHHKPESIKERIARIKKAKKAKKGK